MKPVRIDPNISKNLIEHFYRCGVYRVEDVIPYVKMNKITKEEFHSITSYNYDGYCESRGIEQ